MTARSMRALAARQCVAVMARKHQCSSSSVSVSTVWRNRACSAARPLGGGSCARLSSEDWCSWIQAVSPAARRVGTSTSSVVGERATPMSASAMSAVYRSSRAASSSCLISTVVPPVSSPLSRKSVSSAATPLSRQRRMCRSTAMSSCRGVKSGACSKASADTGHVSWGGTKPTSRKQAPRRRSSNSRPMSDVGMRSRSVVTRKRSFTGAVPRASMRSHALDRADRTDAVRGSVSRSDINPWASCSTTLSSRASANSWSDPVRACATRVSI